MDSPNLEAYSVIGIEIGSVHTRAVLFDVVEDSYHLIGSGVAASTHQDPNFDIGEGVFQSISHLQETTGRLLLDTDGNLIIPSAAGGEGVDRLAVTTSCGPELSMVTFGQLADVSLDSANRLANAMYGTLVEKIGINDRRPASAQLDAVLAADPDLIIFSGGTDGGASRSVQRMGQLISSTLQLFPRSKRPHILYCGNQDLGKKISEQLDRFGKVRVTPNIRPTIDNEILDPAMRDLAELVMEITYNNVGGLKRLAPLCSVPPILSNVAFGRVIKFLGKQYDPAKGVLGIDLGSSFTVGAYANHQVSNLNSFSFGSGYGLKQLLARSNPEDFSCWLDGSRSNDDVQDYLWQRVLFPDAVAASAADLAIDLAAARRILQLLMLELNSRNALPSTRFEPILLSGSLINRLPAPGQSLRVILDGLQPLGVCPLILDKHAILPLLGAIAEFNPMLSVQLLESTAFTNLATVVNLVSPARRGNTLLHARLDYKDGTYREVEIKQGSISSIPLASGETGLLTLKPIRQVSIEDMNIFHAPISVSGGVCGVVFDARGRPMRLPEDKEKRAELFNSWDASLGIKVA